MKTTELEKFNLVELESIEMSKLNGGTFLLSWPNIPGLPSPIIIEDFGQGLV